MESFLRRYCELHGREVAGFTPWAVRALLQYDFPGNIRELQNLVERGVIMVENDEPIDVHHLFRSGELPVGESLVLNQGGRLAGAARHATPPELSVASGVSGGREASEYRQALANTRYNVAEAARSLGLTRAQLAYRLKKAGIV